MSYYFTPFPELSKKVQDQDELFIIKGEAIAKRIAIIIIPDQQRNTTPASISGGIKLLFLIKKSVVKRKGFKSNTDIFSSTSAG